MVHCRAEGSAQRYWELMYQMVQASNGSAHRLIIPRGKNKSLRLPLMVLRVRVFKDPLLRSFGLKNIRPGCPRKMSVHFQAKNRCRSPPLALQAVWRTEAVFGPCRLGGKRDVIPTSRGGQVTAFFLASCRPNSWLTCPPVNKYSCCIYIVLLLQILCYTSYR